MQRGRVQGPPSGTLLYRARIAQMLNQLNGCTSYNMHNVQFVPVDDMAEIVQALAWQQEITSE